MFAEGIGGIRSPSLDVLACTYLSPRSRCSHGVSSRLMEVAVTESID